MKSARFVDLQPLRYVRAQGADAITFLQGQLSSDVRRLSATRAQLSSLNSPKGRMLAVLHLIHDGDSTLLEVHESLAETTLRRLRMFVLRAKVTLDPVAPALRAVGLIGDNASEALSRLGLPAPAGELHCARDAGRGLLVLRRLGPIPRFSVTGSAEAIATLLADGAPALPFEAWRRTDIEAGIPVVYPQTSDHFVPQMANLDLLGGISFDKGCYTGQEIVARLHYLGQVKRRLYACRISGPPPAPGASVIAESSGPAVGEVVDAVADAEGAVAGIVLQIAHADDALRLDNGDRVAILHGPPQAR